MTSDCNDDVHLIAALLLNNIGTVLNEKGCFLDAISVFIQANEHRILHEQCLVCGPFEGLIQSSQIRIEEEPSEMQTSEKDGNLLFHIQRMGNYITLLRKRYAVLLGNKKTTGLCNNLEKNMFNDFIEPVHFFSHPCMINEEISSCTIPQHQNDDRKISYGTAVTLFNLAITHRELGNVLESTELLKAAYKLTTSSSCSHSVLVYAVAESQGHVQTLIHCFENKVKTPGSKGPLICLSLHLMIMHNIAYLQLKEGRYQEALVGFANAINRAQVEINLQTSDWGVHLGTTELRIISELRKYICHTLVSMTRVSWEVHDSEASQSLFQETNLALKRWEEECETDASQGWKNEKNQLSLNLIVAQIYHNMGLLNEALTNYSALLETFQKSLPFEDSKHLIAMTYHCMGNVLFDQGYLQEAKSYLLKSLHTKHSFYTEDSESVAATLFCIGKVLHKSDELVDALTVFKRALRIQKKCSCGMVNFGIVKTMYEIGRVLQLQGELYKAAMAYAKILRISSSTLSNSHPFSMSLRWNLKRILYETGTKFDQKQELLDIIEALPYKTSLKWGAEVA